MTFAEIKSEVFRRIRESSSAQTFWTEEDVEASVNEGYGEISDSSEWFERVKIIDILLSHRYYDCYTTLEPCFLRIDVAYNETTSRWLWHDHVSLMDGVDRHWEERRAEPDRLIFRGMKWLGYWPYRATAGGKIRQYYIAIPPVLCEEEDEPGFPQQFHYGLVDYAVYDLLAQDGEADLALEAYTAYLGYDAELTQWVNKRVAIPYRPGWQSSGLGS